MAFVLNDDEMSHQSIDYETLILSTCDLPSSIPINIHIKLRIAWVLLTAFFHHLPMEPLSPSSNSRPTVPEDMVKSIGYRLGHFDFDYLFLLMMYPLM